MKTYYDLHNEEAKRKMDEMNAELVGEFLWTNFLDDFNAVPVGINRPLIEKYFKQMLVNNQAGEIPNGIFGYMSDKEIFRSATELYAYIQLTCKGVQHQFWPQALEQSNPYILKYDVFYLHNKMYELTKQGDVSHDKAHEAELAKIYRLTRENLPRLDRLVEKYPGYAHFLLAYSHYTLALGATQEHQKDHWKAAYQQFLLCQQMEKSHPRASFLVNLGNNIYKDMNFEDNNLEPIKAQIEQHLSQEEIREIKLGVSKFKI